MTSEPTSSSGRGLQAVLVLCTAALAVVLAVVALRATRLDWHGFQDGFRQAARLPKERPLGIAQVQSCTGEVDRCTTCHLGVARKDLAGTGVPEPFRAHAPALGSHASAEIGCSSCHGGTGRALQLQAAHARPGSNDRDPLMRTPHIQAGCARCHVPGDGPGMERLVRGATLFLDLGCVLCHPLDRQGRGGWDFGPDLRSIGRRSVAYLEQSLKDPAANFAQSTMPTFVTTFKDDKQSLTDLIVFLESLVLSRADTCSVRSRAEALVTLDCSSCHAGTDGTAGGRLKHRCVYIERHKQELACKGCHGGGVPPGDPKNGLCPVLKEHGKNCAACHDGRREQP